MMKKIQNNDISNISDEQIKTICVSEIITNEFDKIIQVMYLYVINIYKNIKIYLLILQDIRELYKSKLQNIKNKSELKLIMDDLNVLYLH